MKNKIQHLDIDRVCARCKHIREAHGRDCCYDYNEKNEICKCEGFV